MLNTLDCFELYVKVRNLMNDVLALRKHNFGIAMDKDHYALDWQAAECVARVNEYALRLRLGQSMNYSICWYCGMRLPHCLCKNLAERGIDTYKIEIKNGMIFYK